MELTNNQEETFANANKKDKKDEKSEESKSHSKSKSHSRSHKVHDLVENIYVFSL
jgi:hypothetical protein